MKKILFAIAVLSVGAMAMDETRLFIPRAMPLLSRRARVVVQKPEPKTKQENMRTIENKTARPGKTKK